MYALKWEKNQLKFTVNMVALFRHLEFFEVSAEQQNLWTQKMQGTSPYPSHFEHGGDQNILLGNCSTEISPFLAKQRTAFLLPSVKAVVYQARKELARFIFSFSVVILM